MMLALLLCNAQKDYRRVHVCELWGPILLSDLEQRWSERERETFSALQDANWALRE
jgi:hypothetical protein